MKTPVTPIGNIPTASVLGVEIRRYDHVPLIHTRPVLWGVWCLPADHVQPTMTAVWREEAKANSYLTYCLTHDATCPTCRQPFKAHRRLEADSFSAQRALDLQQGSEPPTPTTRKKIRAS